MPGAQTRSLRQIGSIVALAILWACVVSPAAGAAGTPAPDPPPLAVAPDPLPAAEPAVRGAAQVVTQAPVHQGVAPTASVAPAPSVAPAGVPAAVQPTPARKPKPKAVARPATRPAPPAASPAWVVTRTHAPPQEAWPARLSAAAAPAAQALERRRYALAGLALALVALAGGVVVGVGGRTLREGIA